jgi:hypothetical protein
MACPFFLPVRRLEPGPWLNPPRVPLGDPYWGSCQADPAAPVELPEEHQRELCNYGYARFRCPHFPEGAKEDAVRFSIVKDLGGCTELVYIVEKDHAPVDHGQLIYWVNEDRLEAAHASELVARQARAFVGAIR